MVIIFNIYLKERNEMTYKWVQQFLFNNMQAVNEFPFPFLLQWSIKMNNTNTFMNGTKPYRVIY